MSDAHGDATNAALELGWSGFNAFNSGRMDDFWGLMHPEVVMVTDPLWPGGGTYEGIDGFKRFLEQFVEAFSEVHWEQVREPEVIRDLALFRGRWVGSGASTGIEAASVEFSVVFAARDGRVDLVRFSFDDDEARGFAASYVARG